MHRGSILGIALVLAASLSVAAAASAVTSTLPPESPEVTLGASVSPERIPRNEYVPITATIFGKIATTNGTHPSALREAVLDIDKDVKIDINGFPVCEAGGRSVREPPGALIRACHPALLGKGAAHFEVMFPGMAPAILRSPLLVFNGGEKGGKVTLLIHTFITVPAPTAIVTTVTIERKGTGLHTIAKIPVIAGGSGSFLDFKFELGRRYTYKGNEASNLEARCPDGVFKVNVPKLLFRNEAQTPGVPASTVLKGGITMPCTTKGQ